VGESYSGQETVRQRKDGTLIEVTMAAAPVQDENGRVASHVVVYDDISERRQQEKRLRALIDSSPVALVEFGTSRSSRCCSGAWWSAWLLANGRATVAR
jgi:hypothetical protein